jgi:rRNA maturation protein Nop10
MRVHDESWNNFSVPLRAASLRYQARMTGADTIERKILSGPQCQECGGPTRILRIEPHKRSRRRHVWTLECLSCGTVQAANMPAPRSTH